MGLQDLLVTCALNTSPVDICFSPKSLTNLLDIVPFPEPGAPKITILNILEGKIIFGIFVYKPSDSYSIGNKFNNQ